MGRKLGLGDIFHEMEFEGFGTCGRYNDHPLLSGSGPDMVFDASLSPTLFTQQLEVEQGWLGSGRSQTETARLRARVSFGMA